MRHIQPPSPAKGGYALLLVLVFMGISSLMLAGAMNWISTRANLTARQHAWQTAVAAAESAANQALSSMIQDFIKNDEATVYSSLGKYVKEVPDKKQEPFWNRVTFFDRDSRTDRLSIERLESWRYGPLRQRYQGMQGYYATYNLSAGASLEALPNTQVAALVEYEVQLAEIPVFAYQFFSAMDLEFTPGSSMNFNGRIHANGNLYAYPDGATINFRGDVSATGSILNKPNPEDPVSRNPGVVNFRAKCDENARHLKLPLDLPQTPATLRAMIEMPPKNEKSSSLLGRQRFYNKADLIITLTSTGFRATSGAYNNFTRTIPNVITTNFVSTNVFFDKRQSRHVQVVDFDVARYANYSTILRLLLGREARTVYVDNELPASAQGLNAVRLINGETLPPGGLTLATPDSLYIRGHFNAPEAFRGTTNTSQCLPAALIADAVTVLSVNWQDSQSQSPLASRRAGATTINAAIITGIVPTGGGFYSGGAENYLRLLEDWRNVNLHFNGAIAVFFPSASATAPWGALDEVYAPPRRQFNYDSGLLDGTRLPSGTPMLRTAILATYRTLPAKPPSGK